MVGYFPWSNIFNGIHAGHGSARPEPSALETHLQRSAVYSGAKHFALVDDGWWSFATGTHGNCWMAGQNPSSSAALQSTASDPLCTNSSAVVFCQVLLIKFTDSHRCFICFRFGSSYPVARLSLSWIALVQKPQFCTFQGFQLVYAHCGFGLPARPGMRINTPIWVLHAMIIQTLT